MDQDLRNKEFFEETLQNHYNDASIKIINFEVKSGIGKGENYGSVILRALIHWKKDNLETGEERWVIKTMPQQEVAKQFLTESQVFQSENLYYSVILPMYKSILDSKGIKNYSILAPTYVKCKKPDVVILEDLAPLGFRLGNRQKGEDFNHGLLLLKALARNQALSITVNRKVPGYFDDKTSKLFVGNVNIFENYYSKPMKEQIETFEQWPEFKEYVGRVQPKSGEEILEFALAGDLKAIVQGDCWINNMLFRYDEANKTPVEICILDFQGYFWGSLLFDVIFFMYSSLSPDVLADKKDILIEEYIKELHKWFKILGEKLGEYTRENILKDFKKLEYFGVVVSMMCLIVFCCDPKDALDFENLNDEEGKEQRYKIRNNPTCKQKLMKYLQFFARENLI